MKLLKQLAVTCGGLALGLALVQPVAANVTQYECRFEQERKRGGGWIPEMLVLTHDDQSGEIVVFDPIIQYFVGAPIPARMTDESSARVTFRWEVATQNRGQAARMIYDFTHYTDGRGAKMKALPGGYDNAWSGDGSCKVTAG